MAGGGACSVAAFEQFSDPVEVEHVVAQAGMILAITASGCMSNMFKYLFALETTRLVLLM